MDAIATNRLHSGLPPGPKGTLIGGHIRHFGTDLLDFLLNTAREYGVGPKRVYLAGRPNLIEQVLVRDAKHFVKHFGAWLVGVAAIGD
jgi:hypothetical protein